MRVLLVGPHITLTPGGMSAISERLLAEPMLPRAGVEMSYLASHAEGSAVQKLQRMATAVVRILTRLRTTDVVHLQVATGRSVERKWLLATLCRVFRTPYVLQFHGADLADDFQLGNRLHRACWRHLVTGARRSLVLGEPTRTWFSQRFPESPVSTLANYVVSPSTVAAPPATTVLAFVGRMDERKGVFDLVDALSLLANEDGRGLPRCIFVGDGRTDEVRQLVLARGLGEVVEVRGWAPPEVVDDILRQSTALVLPSYAEGLPMAILEAMHLGRTVITTPVGAVTDAVEDGVSGLLVPPGDVVTLADAIRRLQDDPAGTARMAEAAQARARDSFSSNAIIPRLVEIYREAAGA